MKKLFLSFCSFIILFSAHSQNKFGVRGGISFSNRDGNNSTTSDLVTVEASGFSMIPLSKMVIMQPSIGYHPKGNKYKNLTFSDPSSGNTGYGNVIIVFDNIEITAPFQYMVTNNKDRKFLLGLGPYFSYALGGTVKWKNVSGQVSSPPKNKINFDGSVEKRFDAGLNILLTFQADKHWTLNVSYDRSFISIRPNPYYQQPRLYSHSEGLGVGYFF